MRSTLLASGTFQIFVVKTDFYDNKHLGLKNIHIFNIVMGTQIKVPTTTPRTKSP